MPIPMRLQRSYLAVPGNAERFFAKAAQSAADAVFLDLEDAVAPPDKEAARAAVIHALNCIDWQGKTMTVRINTLQSAYMFRDVIDLVSHCPRLDCLLIPKVNSARDVYAVETLLAQVELASGRTAPVGLEALIETAEGLCNVEAIAQSSSRLEALHFGSGDFAASLGMRTTGIGAMHPGYRVAHEQGSHVQDMWHYAQMRIVVACRAYGLRPIDGPFGAYTDAAGSADAAQRAAILGYEGKQVIHPSQIEAVNAHFAPTPEEVDYAERIIVAMQQGQAAHRGAVSLDGKLIDLVSIRMADNIVDKARRISKS